MSDVRYEFLDVRGQRLHIGSRALEQKGITPVMIFNGIGADAKLLEPLLKGLKVPSLIFDIPGVGGSPASLMPSRMSDLARLAAQLLDELDIAKVHVMGVSWGGGLAQQFAYQHPERSECLILAATSTGHLMIPPSPMVLLRMATPLRYFSSSYFKKIAGDIYGGDFRHDRGRVNSHVKRMASPSLWGYFSQLYAMTGWTSVFFLHKIKQPTLVMSGTDDPLIPVANARILASLIPNARLDLYDCGHLFLLTRLEKAVASIESFVAAQCTVKV